MFYRESMFLDNGDTSNRNLETQHKVNIFTYIYTYKRVSKGQGPNQCKSNSDLAKQDLETNTENRH